MTYPSTQQAIVVNDAENGVTVATVPVPELNAGEVLVRVAYASQNPTDWKHVQYIAAAGDRLGCDFAGVVASSTDPGVKIGDRVAGWVHGGKYKDKGAFAQYVTTDAKLVWHVPDSLPLDQAATFTAPFLTAVQTLIQTQHRPWPPASEGGWIFIYGGSSGVGLFAIQVAKLQGYKVVTVASPHNFDLVKSYGADEVFDYHDAKAAVDNVRRVTGGGVAVALDTISLPESQAISVQTFGEGGGQLNVILGIDAAAAALRPDVKFVYTLLYTWFGKELDYRRRGSDTAAIIPASKADYEWHVESLRRLADLVSKHGVRAPPLVIRGGLEDIAAGLDEMRAGKVSGQRLVYKIGE
ncbi:Zinc-binding oxidoreductase alcohol dehydrogenase [Vanrija albida]|uniref:Zinc-binding oxidoreductase alcohol dehydrogenase n=1 Tax=Vanrija albida TaxID=181172 RepID=A0ABR3PW95_9TREE